MRTRLLRGGALAVCLLVIAIGLVVGTRPDREEAAATTTTTAATTTTTTERKVRAVRAAPVAATVADARGATVDLFSEPGVPYADHSVMDNPTHEGLSVVFLVLEERGAWLRVQVSMRPNGLALWVRRSQVRLRTVPNRIVVRLAERRLQVFEGTRGSKPLLDEVVAVGSARTPTPAGHFFVDGWVPLDGNGPYGAGQLSVAGFSEVLHSFGGGVGQIAIHGTNRPHLLGQPISNGCVRMANEAIDRLVRLAPLGTPVEIIA
ncbi:MAG: L,D-transpeptidase [Acidimicrobiales bacterium]|nr:L,D-transpeptidase [Acidimicrobiales bacterium]